MQYRYHCSECGKTLITDAVVSDADRTCQCGTVLVGRPYALPPTPISQELQTQFAIANANKLRGELCVEWGITNKSHNTHGANFSAPQTLKALIDNIVAPVGGTDRERVRRLVVAKYGYDIDTQMMA